jgi:Na+/H+-dicarboxylate symporter
MGCFMLSTSLLSSMGVPTRLMGIILPFYGIIDMVETALNVWSDSCVTTAVDKPECLRIRRSPHGRS